MAAQFVYGNRADRLIHICDLDPAVERGRDCNCVCKACGRPLQSHIRHDFLARNQIDP